MTSTRPSADFDVTGLVPATYYYEVNLRDQAVTSLQFDSTNASFTGTITLEGTNFDFSELSTSAVSTRWVPLPLTVAGPTTAGSTLVSFSNLGTKRARVKLVVSSGTIQLSLRHSYLFVC